MRSKLNHPFITSLLILISGAAALAVATPAVAAPSTAPSVGTSIVPPTVSPREIYDDVSKSLVAVRYTWDSELGPHELTANGIVIDASGIVMVAASQINDRIPDAQIKNVTIVLPQAERDPLEIPADVQGHDPRSMIAYVKARTPSPFFKPLTFADADPQVGDCVLSVGIMPKSSGYQSYLVRASVAAVILGDHTRAMVDGNLPSAGSPVLNMAGQAVGVVNAQLINPRTDNSGHPESGAPPEPPSFTPSHDFYSTLSDLPMPGHPVTMPWLGISELSTMKEEEKKFYGLSSPSLQISAIAPRSPADLAGLKPGDIIVQVNGTALAQGRSPELTVLLFRRYFMEKRPGEPLDLSIVSDANQPPRHVRVVLAPMPALPSSAERYYASDLGFGVRQATYFDFYQERLPTDGKGLLISVVKPNGPAAASALPLGAFVKQINAQPVTDLAAFKALYTAQRKDHPQDEVLLLIRQAGAEQVIRIQPPR